jgi:hypothetical protein
VIVAYINGLPYTAEDLEHREERLRELANILQRQRVGKDWQRFMERQQNAKIEYVGQDG